jgi:hypothetical protein
MRSFIICIQQKFAYYNIKDQMGGACSAQASDKEASGPVKHGEFLAQMSDYQLFAENSRGVSHPQVTDCNGLHVQQPAEPMLTDQSHPVYPCGARITTGRCVSIIRILFKFKLSLRQTWHRAQTQSLLTTAMLLQNN